MNGEMAQAVDAEITVAPTFDVVEIKGITNGPVFLRNPRILPGKRQVVFDGPAIIASSSATPTGESGGTNAGGSGGRDIP
jgi:hypothetical protein